MQLACAHTRCLREGWLEVRKRRRIAGWSSWKMRWAEVLQDGTFALYKSAGKRNNDLRQVAYPSALSPPHPPSSSSPQWQPGAVTLCRSACKRRIDLRMTASPATALFCRQMACCLAFREPAPSNLPMGASGKTHQGIATCGKKAKWARRLAYIEMTCYPRRS